jgi:hypothetical protein
MPPLENNSYRHSIKSQEEKPAATQIGVDYSRRATVAGNPLAGDKVRAARQRATDAKCLAARLGFA